MDEATQTGLSRQPPPRLAPFLACGAVSCVTILLATVDPARTRVLPPCPFRALTGHWCPGCGSARGIHALLTGDPVTAFAMNPLMIISLPFLLAGFAVWVGRQMGVLEVRPLVLPNRLPWAVLVLVLAFWVLRNVPVDPFATLAP